MRKTTLLKGTFLIATLCAFGCANSEHGISHRDVDDTLDINGAGYASKEISEGNVFGKESQGLPENPLNEPSKDALGPTGVYENLVYSIEPVNAEGYINEFIEFEVEISEDSTLLKTKGRFVVILERPNDGNATLMVDKDYLYDDKDFPPSDTQIIVAPQGNTIRFKMLTGTAYANNDVPMYWVNVWAADAEGPQTSSVVIKRPKKKSESTEGNQDVSNDLSTSQGMDEALGKTKVTSVDITTDEDLMQTILVDTNKTFKVKLDNAKCSTDGSEDTDCDVKDEPICWTLVEFNPPNTGRLISPPHDKKLAIDDKETIQTGCGKVDEDGEISVTMTTGDAYNARYFLNFFHQKSIPLTFQIDTYAMPDTLGEPGNSPDEDLNGDGKPDEGRDIEIPKEDIIVDPVTGQEIIVGCDAGKLIDQLWKTTPDDVKASIKEQCGAEPDKDKSCADGETCETADFKCLLSKESDGSLMLWTCDGDVVMVDLDGDGIADPFRVVVVDNGDGTVRFDGFDTDGDGKPDIAPDPCLYTECPDNPTHKLLCKILKNNAKPNEYDFKACTKVSAGLDEDLDVYLKMVNKENESEDAGSGKEIKAKIIRGSMPSNNAMFENEGGPDTVDLTTDSDGEAETVFWTGTAYDAMYYINLMSKTMNTVMLPIQVIHSVDIPTKPGDKPDDDATKKPDGEAVTPPADMPNYIPDLGPLVMEVAPGFHSEISAPVIRTLGLKIVLKEDIEKTGKTCEKGKEHSCGIISNEKVWWKVTRGPSSANNGSLNHPTTETNHEGYAQNYFYTGTGYDSLYYVSVFHPNVLDKDGNIDPVIFSITTTNNTGTVPGPDPGDPSLPDGETKCPDGSKLTKYCDGKEVKKDTKKCDDNTYPRQVCLKDGCTDPTDDDCTEDPTTINGIDINPNLPNVACADGVTEPCLKLSIVGNAYKRFQIGKIEKSQFKLAIVHDGDESVVANENIHYTLDKGEGVKSALLGKKSKTDEAGKATASFTTGPNVTTFKINAMHPNINKDGNMVPVTLNVSVYDPSQEPSETTDKNIIKLHVDDPSNMSLYPGDTLENVYYYVFPSDKVQCGDDFIYDGTEGRKNGCIAKSEDAYCDIETDGSPYSTSVEVENGRANYTVYAVATNADGDPVASGCVSYQSFPKWTKPAACIADRNDFKSDEAYEAELNEIANNSACTRSMNVNVSMSKLPMVIDKTYQTKTIVNIGPLVKEGTKVGDQIKGIVDKINVFLGTNPEETLTNALTKYVIYLDEDNKPTTAGAQDCMKAINGMNDKKCVRMNGEKMFDNISATCNDWNRDHKYTYTENNVQKETNYTWESATEKKNKEYFTNCNCFCAEMYYWTAVNSMGTKIAKLAKKGIKSLLKKYLSRDALSDSICGIVDELQFITLTGEMTLEKQGASYKGSGKYTGIEVPFLDKPLDPGAKAVEGSWQQAIVSDSGTQIAISQYALNLTYGEFIYELLGQTLGMDENGKIDLLNSLCDKIPGINLLIVDLSKETMNTLCQAGIGALTDKTVQFAASKYLNLNVTLDGSANFKRGTTSKAENGGYYAQLITDGQWDGTGGLGEDKAEGKTADDTINGLWVGARSGQEMPEFTYGDKTVDEFKSENSVCRKMMSEAAAQEAIDNATFNSNQACLGGSFSKDSRLTNHQCKKDACKGKASIVVCDKDGKLNSLYANASAAEIIKAANRACANTDKAGKEDDCDKNPEIVNGGKGVTNADCLKACGTAGCADNSSIFVCIDGTAMTTDDLAAACECGINVSCAETKLASCYQAKAEAGCMGKCDEPGCVMNTEVVKCQAKADSQPVVNAPEKIAEWTFDRYVSNGKDNDQLKANQPAFPDTPSANSTFKLSLVNCNDPDPKTKLESKVVLGADGQLGAYGTNAVSASKNDSSCKFALEIPTSGYDYSHISFKVMGAEREIAYKIDGDEKATSVDAPATAWKTVKIDALSDTFKSGKIYIFMTSPEDGYTPAKMMRLDDIEVWGVVK